MPIWHIIIILSKEYGIVFELAWIGKWECAMWHKTCNKLEF